MGKRRERIFNGEGMGNFEWLMIAHFFIILIISFFLIWLCLCPGVGVTQESDEGGCPVL
ncbi:hypothetical protein MKW98_016435 [Papaver atlanticum]|uniref:Transmembrane protein n=1 Tax=Papaver atlanticum TaxID=357466 RepID=A0AAD4XSQ0_9MAGN|nr:hypothetical protein MKW98_016435 [Papaver atlanticum]